MTDTSIEKISAYVENYLSIKDRVRDSDVERNEAFQLFAAAREQAGLETNKKDFATLCAADLRTLAADFSRFQALDKEVFTVGQLDYSQTGNPTFAVGAYDPNSKKWV